MTVPNPTPLTASVVTPKTREKAAAKGQAMPDGSFPIKDGKDLQRAIQAFGRAKDKGAAKRHIIRRARALGQVDLLPESWKQTAALEFPGTQKQEPVVASAGTTVFVPPDPDTLLALKAVRHNAASPEYNASEAKLKVVYRRGLEDYVPKAGVTPVDYAQARVNSFLRLLSSTTPAMVASVNSCDADLLPRSHPAARPFS